MPPSFVTLVEVGPRDGLQNEKVAFATATKLEFIQRLVAAGIRRLEVTSFVNPQRVPQMADAEAVMAGVPRGNDASYIGLVLNKKGFDRAVAAGCDEVGFVVVASDTFSQRNQGMSTAEGIALWHEIARDAAEGSRGGALWVDVDPLVVTRGVSELVDLFLGDGTVLAVTQVRAHQCGQLFDVLHVRRHWHLRDNSTGER